MPRWATGAPWSAGLVRFALSEALLTGAGQTAAEAQAYGFKKEVSPDWSIGRAAGDVAGAVVSGAVIGGGLLGLEAAVGLKEQGMDVTVLHLMPTLMERQLDPAAGHLLQRAIEWVLQNR